MIGLPTLLYLADVCADLDMLFFIITVILIVSLLIILFISMASATDSEMKPFRTAAKQFSSRAIPAVVVLIVLSSIIPDRDTIYGIILAERAANAPSSPALDAWFRKHVSPDQPKKEQK